ncbi:MAG TPA: hypothetical protein VFK44_06625 [Bacillales bacterium]|nr:hypothetical protein [Bacillales bacterium]
MRPALFEWLLIPFILWGMFQGLLYFHANQVHLALNLATYEGAKEAALQGKYTDDIYGAMKQYLVDQFHYDPEKIEIEGTRTVQPRGEYLTVKITVPRPRIAVLPMFEFGSSSGVIVEEKQIMSEYIAPTN